MTIRISSALALTLLAGAPLAAQGPSFGLAVDLALPTGSFASTSVPESYASAAGREEYQAGMGCQLTMRVPVAERFALGLSLGGQYFIGRLVTPSRGGKSFKLNQQMLSIGAETQYYVGQGSARRQLGVYLLAGAALEIERFDSVYNDASYNTDAYVNRTRVGGILGIGRAYRSSGGLLYQVEVAFHKTFTQTDTAYPAGDPPAADFLKVSFGFTL